MAIDSNAAGVTVSDALPVMLSTEALITEEPVITPVASPPAVMLATAGVADFQFEMAVMFAVVPLEYVPIAINCCMPPMATEGFTGVTAMDNSVPFVTVNTAEPALPPKLALIAAVPVATPAATPVALLTVATAVVAETQADMAVTLREVPSE